MPMASLKPVPRFACWALMPIVMPCRVPPRPAAVAWSPLARPCPVWRSKFAMTKGVFLAPASVAKFTFVVNRSPASTKVRALSWMRTVGSLPGMRAAWTTRGSCFWKDGQTMSLCAAEKIYRRVKSKTFCSPTPLWRMLRWWACPMSNGAKPWLRQWSPRRGSGSEEQGRDGGERGHGGLDDTRRPRLPARSDQPNRPSM